MSVKWPHGRALTNECSHIFQTFSRQSELKIWLREATGGPVLACGPPVADHWQIYWLLCEWPSYFIMHCSRSDRYLSGYSYICWLQCIELTFVTMPKFVHAPPILQYFYCTFKAHLPQLISYRLIWSIIFVCKASLCMECIMHYSQMHKYKRKPLHMKKWRECRHTLQLKQNE